MTRTESPIEIRLDDRDIAFHCTKVVPVGRHAWIEPLGAWLNLKDVDSIELAAYRRVNEEAS